jgi:hypothetical protein
VVVLHCKTPWAAPVVGKTRALARSTLRTAQADKLGFTDNISAAVPATKGAAKLVPTVGLNASV